MIYFDGSHFQLKLFCQLLSINLLSMKCNVGVADKMIRMILALIIGTAGIYFKSWWGLLALLPLATALISFCPLYKFLGLSTCSQKSVQ